MQEFRHFLGISATKTNFNCFVSFRCCEGRRGTLPNSFWGWGLLCTCCNLLCYEGIICSIACQPACLVHGFERPLTIKWMASRLNLAKTTDPDLFLLEIQKTAELVPWRHNAKASELHEVGKNEVCSCWNYAENLFEMCVPVTTKLYSEWSLKHLGTGLSRHLIFWLFKQFYTLSEELSNDFAQNLLQIKQQRS